MIQQAIQTILEKMKKTLTIKKSDWDNDTLFQPLNPETGEYDLFIGWRSPSDENSFGASVDSEEFNGSFEEVVSWLKKRNIIFTQVEYRFAKKKMGFNN